MAVVSARTPRSLELAVDELRGGLTRRLAPARAALIETPAYLDASADFPEDEVPALDLGATLQVAEKALRDVLDSSNLGLLFHESSEITVAGGPNGRRR